MTSLPEIESAIDALSLEQKQELLLFLAARLRAQGGELPPPRKFTREQLKGWMAEDEADMRKLRRGRER